jgi:thioredoxin reductase (NADPH)
MNKPILFIVDDNPQALNTVERDLRVHCHGDYRIVKAASGAEADLGLDRLSRRSLELKGRTQPVSVVVLGG